MNEEITEEITEETPIDDELGAIFDEANAEETAEVVEVVADDGPAREPDGKFAAKETEAPVEAASEEIQADPGAETEIEAVEEQALDAPASWTAAEKAHWPSLTRELQESFLRREGDWQKADSERANKLKGYEPIEAALAPMRQTLQLNGVDDATYVKQLVSADQFLRNDPQGALKWLAQQYGADLSQLNTEGQYQDPSLAPLVGEVTQLKTQLSEFQAAQKADADARVDAELTTFAAEHPHFETVRQQMGALMQAGSAADMKTAYDMAVWANPVTRAQIQAETSAAAEAARKAEADKKAAEAVRTAATNLNSRGSAGGATPPQYNSRDEELGDIYDKAVGAV